MSQNRYYIGQISAVGLGIVIVGGAMLVDMSGAPKKWQVAIAMTALPFWYTADQLRERLTRLSFWVPFLACLSAHVLVVWIAFRLILSSLNTVSFALAIPVVMVEGLLIFLIVDGSERRLRKTRLKANFH